MRGMPIREAERFAGRRLDRRRTYDVLHGTLCYLGRYTAACPGCTEVPEMTSAPDRGVGCAECGYTGKRRYTCFSPVDDLGSSGDGGGGVDRTLEPRGPIEVDVVTASPSVVGLPSTDDLGSSGDGGGGVDRTLEPRGPIEAEMFPLHRPSSGCLLQNEGA